MEELDRKLNELAFRLGMSRQHKKLIKELLVELTQEWYHDGYEEGWEDHRDIMLKPLKMIEEWSELKESSE